MKVQALAAMLLCPYLCLAQDQARLSMAAAKAFEAYAPGRSFQQESSAFGDVNGDGVMDFATFRGDPHYNEKGVENLRVAVFIGAADGSFSFYEDSSEILGHERVNHALKIKDRSVFLHRDGSGGCCSHWAEEFQFKQHRGQLMLIGIETSTFHPDEVPEDDYGVSANLITGQVHRWRGKEVKRSEARKQVSKLKPVRLRAFNYETFSAQWSSVLW